MPQMPHMTAEIRAPRRAQALPVSDVKSAFQRALTTGAVNGRNVSGIEARIVRLFEPQTWAQSAARLHSVLAAVCAERRLSLVSRRAVA